MIDPQTYMLFLLTAAVLVITPGPDTVLVLSRTLASGSSAGLMTLAGTQAGNVAHALAAGFGVSGMVLLVPAAFNILKYVGATYLVYLAVTTWRAVPALALDASLTGRPSGARRYFIQGLTSNLVNPKMVPFFIALFPQFVRPELGNVAIQSGLLGLTLAGMALLWISALVLLAGRFRARIATTAAIVGIANKLAAMTFLGLAGRLMLEDNR